MPPPRTALLMDFGGRIAVERESRAAIYADPILHLLILIGEPEYHGAGWVQPHRLEERGAEVLLACRVDRTVGLRGQGTVLLPHTGEGVRIGQEAVEEDARRLALAAVCKLILNLNEFVYID